MKSFLKKSALCSASCLQALSVAGLGVGAIALATPAAAQDYTRGVLSGTVVDENGVPVAGAEVSVVSNEQGFSTTTTTNESGTFSITALPTGTYAVTVSKSGETIISDPSAAVKAGQTNSYRYTATGESTTSSDDAGNAIVVLGARVQTSDFAANTTGLLVDVNDLVKTVPVQRNLSSVALLAPAAVSGDNGFGDGNTVSISGATVAENSFYVNGLNITDFRDFISPSTVPFEFIRTIDVKTGGLTAEYGRALGGVASMVTKSGSNDFKAGVVANWEPNGLRSHSPDTYAARNSDDYKEHYEANIYVSGPIIKDRLFFYALYAPQHSEQRDTSKTLFARIDQKSNSPFYGGKLDFVIADGHRFEATYFNDTYKTDYTYYRYNSQTTGDISTTPEGSYQTKTGGDSYVFTYTGNFTPWFTLSGSYGRNEHSFRQVADPVTAYVGTTRYPDPEAGIAAARAFGTVTGRLNQQDKREFYRADADFYFDLFGEHHVRAGFDQENLTAGEDTAYNSGYRYYFYNTYIRRYYYYNKGTFKTRYRAFYLQDSWSLLDDRLNLQIGIRNDSFQNRNQEGDVYFEQNNQWGPRLGATFDLFGDQRTKIEAFWGRYYLPLATNTNIRAAGSEVYYRQRYAYPAGAVSYDANGAIITDPYGVPVGVTFNADGSPVLGTALGSRVCPGPSPDAGQATCISVTSDGTLHTTESTVSQGLKPSYSDEWILGITQQLGDFKFGLRYINRRLGRTLEDVAIDRAVLTYCQENGINMADCSSAYSGFGQYVISNPGEQIVVAPYDDLNGQLPATFTFDSNQIGYTKPIRKFDSIQFTFDKPFDGKWSLGGSYTWTKLRGNYEGAVISNINQTDSGLTQDYDQPGFLVGAYGDLANGRRHAFKLYGSWSPIENLLIGFNALVESPRKFSCLGDYDPDGNGGPGDVNSSLGYDPEWYYGAFSYYCSNVRATGGTVLDPNVDPLRTFPALIPRGTAFKSDWNTRLDLGVQYGLDKWLPGSYARVDVFNVLNSKAKLDFNEFGDIGGGGGANPYYQRVNQYQEPRSVRFTVAIRFGGE